MSPGHHSSFGVASRCEALTQAQQDAIENEQGGHYSPPAHHSACDDLQDVLWAAKCWATVHARKDDGTIVLLCKWEHAQRAVRLSRLAGYGRVEVHDPDQYFSEKAITKRARKANGKAGKR